MELLLKDRSKLLELIVNTTSEIIIVLDGQLLVSYMNDAAKRVLKVEEYKGSSLL